MYTSMFMEHKIVYKNTRPVSNKLKVTQNCCFEFVLQNKTGPYKTDANKC